MEIVPGVHLVPGIPWSRVYLVEGKRLALVDAGPPWSAGRVEKYIRRIGRRPEDVAYILVTHSHPDHISGARRLIQRTGASLVAHPMDTESTPNGGSHLSFKGPLGRSRAWLPFLPPTPVGQTAEEGTLLPALDDLRIVPHPGPHPRERVLPPRGPPGAVHRGHSVQRRSQAEPVSALAGVQPQRLPAFAGSACRHGVRCTVRRAWSADDRWRLGQAEGAPDLGP